MSDWALTIAKELKKRNNPLQLGAMLGVVISPLPDIKIKLLDGTAIIDKEQIYLSNALTNRLAIECTFKEFESLNNKLENGKGEIELKTNGSGSTQSGGAVLSLNQHGEVKNANYKNEKENKEKGKLILQTVFNLEPGMLVLVIPNVSEDLFFVIDVFKKAVEVNLDWEYFQK